MADPVCPKHNKPLRRGAKGWYCPTKIREDEDGVKIWCDYKPPKTAPPRTTSAPASSGAPGSPRLEAAKAALHAAALVLQGRAVSASDLMAYADELYQGYLKPAFMAMPVKKAPPPEPEYVPDDREDSGLPF